MKAVDETAQAWQRIKVALTGLLAVVVMIGAASLVFGAMRRDRVPAEPRPTAAANLAAPNSTDPAEPLAELGVAPSAQANTTDAAR